MPVIVTTDMYSGVPNPAWELTDDQATQLKTLLSEARKPTELRSPAGFGLLGYRGFLISAHGEEALPGRSRVFDGVLDIGEPEQQNYVDHDSKVEQFLLSTAGPALEKPQ